MLQLGLYLGIHAMNLLESQNSPALSELLNFATLPVPIGNIGEADASTIP
jgi:hypothetical protein